MITVLIGHRPDYVPNRVPTDNEDRLFQAIGDHNLIEVNLVLQEQDLDVNAIRRVHRYYDQIHDRGNHTPLSLAIKQSDVDIVRALLRHPKIDVNKEYGHDDGESPLHCAILNIPYDNPELSDAWTIFHDILLPHERINVNIRDRDGDTPLHIATKQPQVIRALLVRNANPNSKNDTGRTPLHIVCAYRHWADDFPNGDPEHLRSAHLRDANTVSALLQAGATPFATNRLGKTPLHEACIKSAPPIVNAILNNIPKPRERLDLLARPSNLEAPSTALDVIGENTIHTDQGRANMSETRRRILYYYQDAILEQHKHMCIHAILQDRADHPPLRQRRRQNIRKIQLSVGMVTDDELLNMLEFFHYEQPCAIATLSDSNDIDKGLPPVFIATRIDWPLDTVFDLLRKNPNAIISRQLFR